MSTSELKNKLKEKIESLNEAYFLEELLNIIELESNKSDVFEIPEAHSDGLEKSLNQMDKGAITTHEQVMNDLHDGLKD